jgi:hypothetical protein
VGGKIMENLIRSYGIGFYEVSAYYQTAYIDPKLLKDAQSSDNLVKMLMTFHKMKGLELHLKKEKYHACEGSELILYHPGNTIGYFAGEVMVIITNLTIASNIRAKLCSSRSLAGTLFHFISPIFGPLVTPGSLAPPESQSDRAGVGAVLPHNR